MRVGKTWAVLAAAGIGTAGGVVIGGGAAVVVHDRAAAATPAILAGGDAAGRPKQLWTCGMHPQVIEDHPGNCPICHMKLTPLHEGDDGAAGGPRKVAYWWDPMLGPSSIADGPGKSAMGMDRVPVYEDQVRSGPGVRIDPAVVQDMGVRTAPVERGPLTVTVRAVGVLEVPEPAMTDVTVRVGGYVERLMADTDGMSVARGQVLFDPVQPGRAGGGAGTDRGRAGNAVDRRGRPGRGAIGRRGHGRLGPPQAAAVGRGRP